MSMRGVGQALARARRHGCRRCSRAYARPSPRRLVATPPRVERGGRGAPHGAGDPLARRARPLEPRAHRRRPAQTILANARAAGFKVAERSRRCWRCRRRSSCRRSTRPAGPCRSTPSSRCSSSTPRARPASPRAWSTCTAATSPALAHTMKVSFDARPGRRDLRGRRPRLDHRPELPDLRDAGCALHRHRRRGLARLPVCRTLRVDDRALRRADLQGRRDLPQDGHDRPAERRRRARRTTWARCAWPPSAPSR